MRLTTYPYRRGGRHCLLFVLGAMFAVGWTRWQVELGIGAGPFVAVLIVGWPLERPNILRSDIDTRFGCGPFAVRLAAPWTDRRKATPCA